MPDRGQLSRPKNVPVHTAWSQRKQSSHKIQLLYIFPYRFIIINRIRTLNAYKQNATDERIDTAIQMNK